ncbi:MAG: pentapeptide repeat-containing protein, partial [Clostridiaceae bacterium]
MTNTYEDKRNKELKADCRKCFGLCCIALYFSASEGFPTNKDAGKPCINLQSDFTCSVHKNLRS